LKAPNKIAFAHLWPNARPWRLASPEPTLRALADVQSAAEILASAMKDVTPIELMRPAPSRERVLTGVGAHPDAVAA
jgi:hypothetical protein